MLKYIVVAALFLCVVRQSTQCSVAPGYKFLTVEQRVQNSSYVLEGYLTNKIGANNSYKACLLITTVYKKSPYRNSICADDFGSSAACKTDLSFGVKYLFFLEKRGSRFAARYTVDSSAVPTSNSGVRASLKSGLCSNACPRHFKKSRCTISNMKVLCYNLRRRGMQKCYCAAKRSRGPFG